MSLGMHTSSFSPTMALRSPGSLVTVSVEQLKSDLLCASSRRGASSKPRCSPPASPGSNQVALAPLGGLRSVSEGALVEHVTHAELLGCWVDSIGNFVIVRSADTPGGGLMAMLVKPWAESISLSLWQEDGASTWNCGRAALDLSRSSAQRLVWAFPEGRQMVWTWRAFTPEALTARGLDFAQDMACSEADYHASPPSTPGSEPSSQKWVPVCVPVEATSFNFKLDI